MVMIFGSINVDLIVPVPSLPQPGETVLGGDYRLVPGGKGANQALAARRAGAEVVLAGAVGSDSFAEMALGLLRRDGVDTRLVQVVERPTGCAAIMVSAAGENMIAVAPGANAHVRSDQVPDELLDAGTTLVAQVEVPLGETDALIRRVRARGGTMPAQLGAGAADRSRPLAGDRSSGRERKRGRGDRGRSGAARPPVAARARDHPRRGAGRSRFSPMAAGSKCRRCAIEPVDTTGAGDTFVGVLAAALDLRIGASKPRCGGPAPRPALPASPAALRPRCRTRRRSMRRNRRALRRG